MASFQQTLFAVRGRLNRPHTKRLLAIVAYVFSALCLIWVFRGIDLHTFIHQFEVLKPSYLCIAIACSTAVYFANSLRWLILLRPMAKVSFWRTVQSVYIGLYLNEVLPLRPGELIRCYLLSRWSKLPLTSLFASAAVERVLDGLLLMVGFFAVTFAIKLPRSLLTGAIVLAACIVLIAAGWIIYAARRRSVQAIRDAALPSGASSRPGFLTALASMGSTRVVLAALAVGAVSLIFLILSMWFLMKGGDIGLSLAQGAAVFLIIRVGTVLPAAPGNIGSYQFFCVLAMGLFGIDRATAAAFSLLVYSALTVPLLIGGTIAVAASGLKFRTLLTAAEA